MSLFDEMEKPAGYALSNPETSTPVNNAVDEGRQARGVEKYEDPGTVLPDVEVVATAPKRVPVVEAPVPVVDKGQISPIEVPAVAKQTEKPAEDAGSVVAPVTRRPVAVMPTRNRRRAVNAVDEGRQARGVEVESVPAVEPAAVVEDRKPVDVTAPSANVAKDTAKFFVDGRLLTREQAIERFGGEDYPNGSWTWQNGRYIPVKPKDVPTPKESKVYSVRDAEAIKAASPAVEPVEPQKMPYTWWWQTPDYLGEVERRAADAEKQAELDKKRLRRERNAAIISDIAKLGAQAFMLNGGVTNIERFTPNSKVVNDKIASLSEKRAAQIAAFAKERAAARAAQVADNNARMKLEMTLAADDAKRKAKEKSDAYNRAWEVHKQEMLENFRAADLAIKNKNAQARLAAQGNGNSDEYDAYQEMIAENPDLAVKKKVPKRNEYGDYVKDEDGNQVYEWEEELNPTINQIRNALARGRRAKKEQGATSRENTGTGSPMNRKNNQGNGAY